MNVLRIIHSMDPKSGGPCEGIRQSIKALSSLGVITEVVCLDDPMAEYLKNDDFLTHALGPINNPWSYSKKFDRWLAEHIARFDNIIIHGLWLYPSFAAYKQINRQLNGRAKASTGNPQWFVMPHGMLDPYFQLAPERKLKALRNRIYWQIFEKQVINAADGVLFTSEEEKLLARTTFPAYRPKREINIGYGIDHPPEISDDQIEALKSSIGLLATESYFLFLSRIHPKKGVLEMLGAYLDVLKSHGSKGISIPKLVVAGPGMATAYGQDIEEFIELNKELQGKVIFSGMLTGDMKWAALNGADLYMLVSHQENFGIAVAEALSCGKPVLISSKVNIWREIEEARAGIIVRDTRAGAYDGIKQWVEINIAAQTEMRENAVAVFQRKFYIHTEIQRLYAVLSGKMEVKKDD